MLRFFILMIGLVVTAMCQAGEIQCFKTENVKIKKPYYHKEERDTKDSRRDTITVRHKVDCKTGRMIVPKTFDEAIEMLDFALPYDYKVALVRSALRDGLDYDPADYSDYGESVVIDLREYFSRVWALSGRNNICAKKFGTKNFVVCWNECFTILEEGLLFKYVSLDILKERLEPAPASDTKQP